MAARTTSEGRQKKDSLSEECREQLHNELLAIVGVFDATIKFCATYTNFMRAKADVASQLQSDLPGWEANNPFRWVKATAGLKRKEPALWLATRAQNAGRFSITPPQCEPVEFDELVGFGESFELGELIEPGEPVEAVEAGEHGEPGPDIARYAYHEERLREALEENQREQERRRANVEQHLGERSAAADNTNAELPAGLEDSGEEGENSSEMGEEWSEMGEDLDLEAEIYHTDGWEQRVVHQPPSYVFQPRSTYRLHIITKTVRDQTMKYLRGKGAYVVGWAAAMLIDVEGVMILAKKVHSPIKNKDGGIPGGASPAEKQAEANVHRHGFRQG